MRKRRWRAWRGTDPEARIFINLGDLLAWGEFDAAVVMLSPDEATGATIRLAEAGKHMFIEKQAARTAPELLPLCQLAQERNLVVQAGYPWPRHQVAQEIRRCLDEGVLGKLLAMEARLVTVQVGPGLREPEHWMYRRETEGGGILHMRGRALADAFPDVCAGAGALGDSPVQPPYGCDSRRGRGRGYGGDGVCQRRSCLSAHGLSAERGRPSQRHIYGRARPIGGGDVGAGG